MRLICMCRLIYAVIYRVFYHLTHSPHYSLYTISTKWIRYSHPWTGPSPRATSWRRRQRTSRGCCSKRSAMKGNASGQSPYLGGILHRYTNQSWRAATCRSPSRPSSHGRGALDRGRITGSIRGHGPPTPARPLTVSFWSRWREAVMRLGRRMLERCPVLFCPAPPLTQQILSTQFTSIRHPLTDIRLPPHVHVYIYN